MNHALVVLAVLISAVTDPQPVYRCDDGFANVAYQDTPCPVLPSQPFLDTPNAPGAWNAEPPDQQRIETEERVLAMELRVQQLLKPANDLRAAQYAVNRQRCQDALRVAELCGKFAGTFYCDEKGFKSIAEAGGGIVKTAAINNAGKYRMERCALDAAKSSPSR